MKPEPIDNNIYVSALFDVASTSGYQIVASTSEAKQIKDLVLTNIQGRLVGDGIDEQLPTIAIVTHYDSFGIAPVSIRILHCATVKKLALYTVFHNYT